MKKESPKRIAVTVYMEETQKEMLQKIGVELQEFDNLSEYIESVLFSVIDSRTAHDDSEMDDGYGGTVPLTPKERKFVHSMRERINNS
jgi:hypothetical protein